MIKEAIENWKASCCSNNENSLKRNDTNKAYELVKNLTKVKQAKVTIVKDKSVIGLTQEQDILNRRNEYCSELYNYPIVGD